MISGRVLGPCHEGAVPAIAFSIGSGSKYERILLPRERALPSLSPFLLYRIKVRADEPGPLWSVAEVSSVEPLPVYQADLADALALACPHDSHAVREALAHDLVGKNDPLLPGDVPERQRVARDLIVDAWQSPTFYRLLPYFPGSFLRALDPDEMAFVFELFLRDPIIFAHWSVATRALEMGVRPEKLRVSMEALRRRNGWQYDERCPALQPGHVKALSVEASSALRWVLSAEERFYEKGDLIGPCSEEDEKALQAYCMTFRGPELSLVDPASASVQARLVIELRKLDLYTANCETYDEDTVKMIRAIEPEWRICAARPPLEPIFGALCSAPRLAIVHAHKLGPERLLRLLEPRKIKALLLIGDPNETPAHYAAGGGDLFRDLTEASSGTALTFPPTTSHQRATLDSLAVYSTAHLSVIPAFQDGWIEKVVATWAAQRKSVTKTVTRNGTKRTIQVRPEQTWVVLCSSEERRAQLRAILSLDEVRVGQRVHLLDLDEVGTLKHAVSVPTRKAAAKKGCLYRDEDYEMHIDTGERLLKVKRSETQLEMSDVALASRWIGPIVDAVLFVTDDDSSIEEISGTVKYAKSEFAIATTRREQFVDLPRRRPSRDSMIPMMMEQPWEE